MSKFKDYKDLDIWRKSIALCDNVYKTTRDFPKEELFGLTNQLRRASISIPSNIAEGFGRKTQQQFIYFLQISLGSTFEIETQLIIAQKQEYVNKGQLQGLLQEVEDVKKLINGMIRHYKRNTKP
jgi:four helix bundle protein